MILLVVAIAVAVAVTAVVTHSDSDKQAQESEEEPNTFPSSTHLTSDKQNEESTEETNTLTFITHFASEKQGNKWPCSSLGQAEDRVMVMVGGEQDGQVVNTVDIFPYSFSECSRCISPLPDRLKWGNLGFVSGTLLMCGGEVDSKQSQKCLAVDRMTGDWRHVSNLTDPRSQSASTVSAGGDLVILGGYSDFSFEDQYQLATMQRVGNLTGPQKEQQLSHSFRLASVVAYSNGQMLITGGKNSESKVFLLSFDSSELLHQRQGMKQGRSRHAGALVTIGQEEQVVVAGGHNVADNTIDSVETYSRSSNSWSQLPSLPQPRADFMLWVREAITQTNYSFLLLVLDPRPPIV